MSEKAKSNTMIPHVKLFRKSYVLQVSLSYFSLNDYRDGHDSRAEEFTLSSESEEELRDYNLESADVLLGQFEKVSRTKSKWKCFLKDGIITVDGKDLAFSRAVGEFRWA
ncbi:transcription factor IIA, alpha/beta subunit-domain-containing protein [Ostreococcus tauri]|uniref:Transcription factor IIA, alpha/beta subunit-domain-containing protein n=1 Tax=Ostreococcus tauri TaxID=70448 RepID=A0A1Y5HXL2_OSTTA|nr:transcription factor IIA, alpha/beta subunit-domain-containing protein [Ostreococcus tauri]